MEHQLGYTQPLYILAFDHRASFIKKMFGEVDALSAEQIGKIKEYKQIIYEGFLNAVEQGIPKESAAVLVDEQFGDAILRDAKKRGFVTILTTEKSGQEEFDFEYGESFAEHIRHYNPTFTKALVRYDPRGDTELNKRQQEKLKLLSDFSYSNGYKFFLEVLIPRKVPSHIRAAVDTIGQLQQAGVEPDIWKLEGFDNPNTYQQVVSQARSGGRENVSIVILGRGEDDEQVARWLEAGRGVEGVIGFAIGRTIFMDALLQCHNGSINRNRAAEMIAEKYFYFYKKFTS